MRKEMLRYEVCYLENSPTDGTEKEKFTNDLGNIILLSKSEIENKRFSQQWTQEKKEFLQELGKNCLMNLELQNWTEVEDIDDLVERRKKFLIKDFERLGIFNFEDSRKKEKITD